MMPTGLGLGGKISVADHAGTAGAIIDDDPMIAPLLDVLGEQPGRDVHPAAGRVDHGVFDRGGGKVVGLEPDEFGFGVAALRRGGSDQQRR
jgi:hypothetical protein